MALAGFGDGPAMGSQLAGINYAPIGTRSACTSPRHGNRCRTPTRRVASTVDPRATGPWIAAAQKMRCEDAKLYYDSRVFCRQTSRNDDRRLNTASTTSHRHARGSSGSRSTRTTFLEHPPHWPLVTSPLLNRLLRHRPCLRARRLGACHNRHHVRSHLLDALDLVAQDVASPPSPSNMVDRDTPPPRPQLTRRAKFRRNLRSIVSQNCRGLKTSTRKSELLGVLRWRHTFAACLQETWRTGIEELLEDDWLFIGSAPSSQHGRGSQGTAIALSPQAAASLDEKHVDLGPRVVAVRLLTREAGPRARSKDTLGVFLISAYAPISTALETDWDGYYDSLSAAIARAHNGDIVVIGTDANASIGRGSLSGSTRDTRSGAVGPHGLEHIDSSGRRLRSFLETHALASLASFFRKPHYGTWQHPRSKLQHQLDHMLVTRSAVGSFTDAGSLHGQMIHSDHRAIGCKLRVAIRLQRTARAVSTRSKLARLDYTSLTGESAAISYSENVLRRIGLQPPPPSLPSPPSPLPQPPPSPHPYESSPYESPPLPSPPPPHLPSPPPHDSNLFDSNLCGGPRQPCGDKRDSPPRRV